MARKAKEKRARPTFDGPADALAFFLECRDKDHYPLHVRLREADGDVRFVHAWVRFESGMWDGCGGRTDLHEIFATLWAGLLRANGVASAALLDMEGWCAPAEIYSRTLLFRQPFDARLRPSEVGHYDRLRAHTALASHELAAAVALLDPREVQPRWQEKALPWLEAVRSCLRSKPSGELFVGRRNPTWRYYKADGEITLLELAPGGVLSLREACRLYTPHSVRLAGRLVLSAGGIHNSVSLRTIVSVRPGPRL